MLVFCGLSSYVSAGSPKEVSIVIDDSYPPYSFVENGKAAGIYIDLIRLAAKRLEKDYHIKFVPMPWKRALQEVKMGNAFAVVPPFIHTEKRSYIWPYSAPLAYERVVVYCQKSIAFRAHLQRNPKEVKPLNIGINSGFLTLNEQLIRAEANGLIKMRENRSTRANIQKLISKRVDCYLNDPLSTKWVLKQLQKQNPSLNLTDTRQMMEVMVQSAHIGYTNSKSRKFRYKSDFIKRMDKALAVVKRDKALEKIITKYLEN